MRTKLLPHLCHLEENFGIETKADLLDCLALDDKKSVNMPGVDEPFIDGAAAVQMMHPGIAIIFQD